MRKKNFSSFLKISEFKLINLKKLKPGTLLVVNKHPNNGITSISYADDYVDVVKHNIDNQQIMTLLQYREGVEEIRRQHGYSAPKHNYKAFITKIQVLCKEKKFWILMKETRIGMQDFPDDLKEDFRLCGWIDILESED